MSHSMKFDSEETKAQINAAVTAAEALTGAEIVPVVARCSGRYDRAEDIVGLWVAAVCLAAVYWFYPPPPPPEAGQWGEPSRWWHLTALLASLPIGFLIGATLATWATGLRKLFTPRQQMQAEVFAKARAIFFDRRVHHTAESSGVLLYVSRHERMAAIVADESVLTALGQARIDTLCRDFTARLRTVGPSAAFCETIAEIGEQLSSKLPRSADDRNELPDALVLMD
jgi:putative membrane protein